MAAALGISPSYLNLIERNQRPLSARVLVQVIERFDFDPRMLRRDETIGGVDGLARRLADERFADLGIDRDEVNEFLAAAPQASTEAHTSGLQSLMRITSAVFCFKKKQTIQ